MFRKPIPPSPGGAGRIKGAAFREFVAWVEEQRGATSFEAMAKTIPEAERRGLELGRPLLGILASEWYPAGTVHRLLDALVNGMTDAERRRLADEGARAVMARTLRGPYRTLFSWMATPARYARFAPKLWAAYYDSGTFEVDMPDSCRAIATIRKWAAHHPFMCDLNRGAAASIYESMGCRGVRVERVACVDRGDDCCRFETTWQVAR